MNNGFTFRFPDAIDTLTIYLDWEGILGYTNRIAECETEDELQEFLDYEGIYGYTDTIWDILQGGSAYCSAMDEDDFKDLCRTEYLDPSQAEVEGDSISNDQSYDNDFNESKKLNEWEDNGYKQHVWITIHGDDPSDAYDEIIAACGEPDGEGDWDDGGYVLDYYFDDLDSAREFADNIPDIKGVEWDEEEMDESLDEGKYKIGWKELKTGKNHTSTYKANSPAHAKRIFDNSYNLHDRGSNHEYFKVTDVDVAENLQEKLVYGIYKLDHDKKRIEVDRVDTEERAIARVEELGKGYWWDPVEEKGWDESLNEADMAGKTITIPEIHDNIEAFLKSCKLINYSSDSNNHFNVEYNDEALEMANPTVLELISPFGIDITEDDEGDGENEIEVSIYWDDDSEEFYYNYPNELNDDVDKRLREMLNDIFSDDAVRYNIKEMNKDYIDESFDKAKLEEEFKLKEDAFTNKVKGEYRKWCGLDEAAEINESNLDDEALNHVSCKYNYDKNDLIKDLIG